MTTPGTINKANKLRVSYGRLSRMLGIGSNTQSLEHFRQIVPTPAYRFQCIHHAAALGKPFVLYVVAKSSRNGVGEIIYAVLLQFSELLCNNYLFMVDAVRVSTFQWVGEDATLISIIVLVIRIAQN